MTDRWIETLLTDIDNETEIVMRTGSLEEQARCLARWTVLLEEVNARRAQVLAIFAPAIRHSVIGTKA